MRMTKQRKDILDVLTHAKEPLSPESLYTRLDDQTINLSTVYRSLETFFHEKMIYKTIINQKQYYYTGHHHHFLFCLSCQHMIPVGCHLEGKEKALGEPYGFQVSHHDMTIYGYCKQCQH